MRKYFVSTPVMVRVLLALCVAIAAGCRTPAPIPCGMVPDETMRGLGVRAIAAIDTAGESPGREFANRLQSEFYPAWIQYFMGKGTPPSNHTVADSVKDITHLVQLIADGHTWPVPPTLTVPRTSVPIQLDGKLDDPAWIHAAILDGLYLFNEKMRRDMPASSCRILWDDHFLYFGFECKDADIVAPKRARDDLVFNDDCVEIFLRPEDRFPVYWEVVISPGGDVYDALDFKYANRWGAVVEHGQNLKQLAVGVQSRGTLNQPGDTDDGYTIEIAIPFAELPGYSRLAPEAGQKLRFALARLDRSGGKFTAYSFFPLLGWGHNIWNHGTFVLGR